MPTSTKPSRSSPPVHSASTRSEEHTSELQSRSDFVCRLLLEIEKHTSELQSRSDLVCRLLLEKKHKKFIPLCFSCIVRSPSLLPPSFTDVPPPKPFVVVPQCF